MTRDETGDPWWTECQPIRRACNPSAPSASNQPLHRRNVRAVTPSPAPVAVIVTSRGGRRADKSSTRIGLTSGRILARVIVARLEGAPCYVHKDLAICGGEPVIVGTRIPVRLIYQHTNR